MLIVPITQTHATKPPGPFGTLQRLYVHITAPEVTPSDLAGTPLTYSGIRPDGTLVALYTRRTMKPDDDETAIHELSVILYQFLGLDDGWKVDWRR